MDKQWFNKSIEEVKEQLKVGNQGLSDEQVKEKREIYGLNELQAQKKKSLIVKFLERFYDYYFNNCGCDFWSSGLLSRRRYN